MQLTLEFGGGLELLCDSVKVHNVDVVPPKGSEKLIMKDLLSWDGTNLIKERSEMFMKGDSVLQGNECYLKSYLGWVVNCHAGPI